ncbi:MAG: hypothetical protein AB8H86_25265 [Polyangiales bacterium]
MTSAHLASVVAALSLTSFSAIEAQESSSNVVEGASSEGAAQAAAPAQEPVEPGVVEPGVVEPGVETQAPPPPSAEQAVTPPAQTEASVVRLRFRSIRLYAGAALQMAPVDSPSTFETLCELPCNVDVEPGSYRLNVLRDDGNEYALPTAMSFASDTRVSLKYGASTGSWVGGILALTGILGVLISGGVAIAGAANDNSGQTTGGLVGLGVSSLVFGGGLVTFLLSERGLRAEVIPED